MSDQIPIRLWLADAGTLERLYGPSVGAYLANPAPSADLSIAFDEFNASQPASVRRRVNLTSRGGFVVGALRTLLEANGAHELLFLGDASHTHQVAITYDESEGFAEIRRFTVLADRFDQYISAAHGFLGWCRANPHDVAFELDEVLGSALDGRAFEDVADVLDSVQYSLFPNNEYCDYDSWNVALLVCVVRTFIYLSQLAKSSHGIVVCEQWGGFRSGTAG